MGDQPRLIEADPRSLVGFKQFRGEFTAFAAQTDRNLKAIVAAIRGNTGETSSAMYSVDQS